MVIDVAIIQILRRIDTCGLAPNVISQAAYTRQQKKKNLKAASKYNCI